MRAKEKHKHTKNDKEKGTGITKYTGQKKINEGHSIERVWHSASRETVTSEHVATLFCYRSPETLPPANVGSVSLSLFDSGPQLSPTMIIG